MSRTNTFTVSDIWELTEGGELIFEKEIGYVDYFNNVCSPIDKDIHPSFRLYKSSSGIVYGKDYRGLFEGNAISLIMEMYSLSFSEAIQKIVQDFKLNKENVLIKKDKNISKLIKIPKVFDVETMPFTDKHKKYMDRYHLDETYLNNEGDCYALKKWAKDKKIQKIEEGHYKFVYIYKNKEGKETGHYKILTLGKNVLKEEKWKTNVPNHWLWGLHKIPKDVKQLWVVKSNKDRFVLNKHFNLSCIAVQNEDPWILLKNNYELIEDICKNIIVCFGTDFQGWHASLLITTLTGWDYFNTDNNLLNYDVEDPADYVYKLSVKSLEKKLKLKNFI